MGYVHLTDICQFIPPSDILKTAGTWTPTVSSNLITDVRSAADASFDLLIPVVLPGSNIAKQGAKLVSIDLWYIIGTAAADDFATVELNKVTLPADGVAPTGAAVDVTIDADHDTGAERKAQDEHKMNVALDTPAFIEDDEAYWLHCVIDAAAGTVFSLVGAQANFTLRL
jgi:hypothetical protein